MRREDDLAERDLTAGLGQRFDLAREGLDDGLGPLVPSFLNLDDPWIAGNESPRDFSGARALDDRIHNVMPYPFESLISKDPHR